MALASFLQATDAKRPPKLDATFRWNREDSMTFDGGDVMSSADFASIVTGKKACTIYMVVEGGTQSDAWPVLWAVGSGSAKMQVYCQAATGTMYFQQKDDEGDAKTIAISALGDPIPKTVIALVNYGDATGAKAFVNDTGTSYSEATFNSGIDDVTIGSGTMFLAGVNSTPSTPFVGEIPGIWACDVAHTDAEVERNMEWLRDTYCVDGWGYDGSSSYSTISDHADLDFDDAAGDCGDWSIGGWVKLEELTLTYGWLLSIGNYNATPSLNVFFKSADNKLYLQGESNDATSTEISSSSTPGTSTGWAHVLVTYTTATTTLKLYIDGVEVASDAAVDFDEFQFTGMYFGDSDQVDAELNGTLRDWGKWDRVLGAAEITELVAGGYAADTTGGAPTWNVRMEAADENIGGSTPVGVGSLSVTNTNVTGVYK